jgi:AraC-like DNA-binding protein
MTITLTCEELDAIWEESIQNSVCSSNLNSDEKVYKIPKLLGEGYSQEIQVYPEIYLSLLDYEYRDDVLEKTSTNEHKLHFDVLLSGKITIGNGQFGEGYTLICGGGIQRKTIAEAKKGQRIVQVSMHIPHNLFVNFFSGENEAANAQLRHLVNENDWQTILFPKSTPAIQGVAQQIINCPFQGVTKKIYLHGKIFELIALQLAPILENEVKKQTKPRLKPDTVARIHHARDILHCRLQNPPSSLELAQNIGVSERTLRRGFRELFDTTVFGYLMQRRMEKAQMLLREGNSSVAEVANLVGYSHLGLFANVFKRQYGISPKECLMGKKSLSGS